MRHSGRALLSLCERLFYFANLERRFLEAHGAFDPDVRPLPDAHADHGRWQGEADAILDAMDHPSRVAGITRHQIRRLRDAVCLTVGTVLDR